MPSKFRIPKADLSGPFGRLVAAYSRRMFGEVPDNVYVLAHHRGVLTATGLHEQRVTRWKSLDPQLKVFAQMAPAALIGCSWCLDFGYYLAHQDGLDPEKVRQVPAWRNSDVFTPLERDVLEYAEAMTVTPPVVTDEMVENLRAQLGDAAMVELTAMVALENERSRMNSAMGLASQGYSDSCGLPPLADDAETALAGE